MARSILARTGERERKLDKGRTTRDLGPSDRSDTGSDIAGGPGLEKDSDALGLERGTTSDAETSRRPSTAGPDIGDENLDGDSDTAGTGERAAAGRDAPPPTDESLSVIDELTGASELVDADDLGAKLADTERDPAQANDEARKGEHAPARRRRNTRRRRGMFGRG